MRIPPHLSSSMPLTLPACYHVTTRYEQRHMLSSPRPRHDGNDNHPLTLTTATSPRPRRQPPSRPHHLHVTTSPPSPWPRHHDDHDDHLPGLSTATSRRQRQRPPPRPLHGHVMTTTTTTISPLLPRPRHG